MRVRRIHPDPAGPVTPTEAVGGLGLGDLAPAERPYLIVNMASTADGKATIDGRAGGIGNEADRQLFHALRTQVDAVLVGAGTVRAERYGRLVRDPALRARREREGLAPDPLACVVSGRLDLPSDLPLLQDPDSRVLVLTASEGELAGSAAGVEYLRAPGPPLALAPVLRALREEHAVRSLLCEGGPTLNSDLLREGLVDELFLTLAPKLAGGDALTIVAGERPSRPVELELVWALEAEGHLFLRYRVRP